MPITDKENNLGDCFKVGLELLIDLNCPDAKLCHGIAVGQGPIEGIRFVHAWVELNGLVIDGSNGKSVICPVSAYYKAGRISKVTRYRLFEASAKVCESEHYGPWEPYLLAVKEV